MKILVPIDGSKYSRKAIEKAKELGAPLNAEITLLNVVNPEVNIRGMQNREFYDDINKSAMANSREVLNEGLSLLNDYTGKIETTSFRGDPVDEIIRVAEDQGYDLIVMGSRGAGVFSRTLLGSVSNKVIHHVKTSVLIAK